MYRWLVQDAVSYTGRTTGMKECPKWEVQCWYDGVVMKMLMVVINTLVQKAGLGSRVE